MGLITDISDNKQMHVYVNGDFLGTLNLNWGVRPPWYKLNDPYGPLEEYYQDFANTNYLATYNYHVYIHIYEFSNQEQLFSVWLGSIDYEPAENWWQIFDEDLDFTI